MRPLRRSRALLLLVSCTIAMGGGAAGAADLYLSGQMAMAWGQGKSGGSVDLGPSGSFPNTGSDTDTSPVFSGAVGYEFPLSELVPHDWDWPLPEYAVRVEFQGLGGRDYEFVTQGPDPYLSRVTAWSVLNNLWLDLPVHEPVSWLFGRVPLLEPMSFQLGAGVGLGGTEVKTTNNVFRGSDTLLGLAWQAGMGLGYQLTDRVSVGLEYRYADLGDVSFSLKNPPAPDPVGNFKLALASHELGFGLRVRFYGVPSPGAWSVRRGR